MLLKMKQNGKWNNLEKRVAKLLNIKFKYTNKKKKYNTKFIAKSCSNFRIRTFILLFTKFSFI